MDKVQMEVVALVASTQHGSGSYALILQEAGGQRRLSILIAADMAQSIALELESIKPPRPVTHDLMRNIIETLGGRLLEVTITELRESTFYATLALDGAADEIDARPSDAIALAVRCGAPIYVSEAVLSEAAVIAQDDEETDEEDEEVAGATEEEPKEDRPKSKRELLQDKLDEAIRNEDYERAAQLRDEIDRLERYA